MTQVIEAYIRDWVVRGEFVEDTQYYDRIYFVIAELADGRTLCHERSFENDLDRAINLAQRIKAAGEINEEHWYEHDFFSRSLQGRLEREFEYENAARKNIDLPYNPWYSEGHA